MIPNDPQQLKRSELSLLISKDIGIFLLPLNVCSIVPSLKSLITNSIY